MREEYWDNNEMFKQWENKNLVDFLFRTRKCKHIFADILLVFLLQLFGSEVTTDRHPKCGTLNKPSGPPQRQPWRTLPVADRPPRKDSSSKRGLYRLRLNNGGREWEGGEWKNFSPVSDSDLLSCVGDWSIILKHTLPKGFSGVLLVQRPTWVFTTTPLTTTMERRRSGLSIRPCSLSCISPKTFTVTDSLTLVVDTRLKLPVFWCVEDFRRPARWPFDLSFHVVWSALEK